MVWHALAAMAVQSNINSFTGAPCSQWGSTDSPAAAGTTPQRCGGYYTPPEKLFIRSHYDHGYHGKANSLIAGENDVPCFRSDRWPDLLVMFAVSDAAHVEATQRSLQHVAELRRGDRELAKYGRSQVMGYMV
jgi:hypothetical protein